MTRVTLALRNLLLMTTLLLFFPICSIVSRV